LLHSRLVLDHKLSRPDAFSVQRPGDQAAIADMLLGGESVPLAEVAAHLA
jgi:hypothetical protein